MYYSLLIIIVLITHNCFLYSMEITNLKDKNRSFNYSSDKCATTSGGSKSTLDHINHEHESINNYTANNTVEYALKNILHTAAIATTMSVDNNCLVIGLHNNTTQIYDLQEEINQHCTIKNTGASGVSLKNNILATASFKGNKPVKIFNIKNKKPLKRFPLHTSVSCLYNNGIYIVWGSYNGYTSILTSKGENKIQRQISDYSPIFTLKGIKDRFFVGTTKGRTALFWIEKDVGCLFGNNNSSYPVHSICKRDDSVISSTLDTTIVTSTNTKKPNFSLSHAESKCTCIKIPKNWRFISGHQDGSIRIRDIRMPVAPLEILIHSDNKNYITSIAYYKDILISACQDRTVKIWQQKLQTR